MIDTLTQVILALDCDTRHRSMSGDYDQSSTAATASETHSSVKKQQPFDFSVELVCPEMYELVRSFMGHELSRDLFTAHFVDFLKDKADEFGSCLEANVTNEELREFCEVLLATGSEI